MNFPISSTLLINAPPKYKRKFLYTDPSVEGCIKGKNGFSTILQLWKQLKISKNKSLKIFWDATCQD